MRLSGSNLPNCQFRKPLPGQQSETRKVRQKLFRFKLEIPIEPLPRVMPLFSSTGSCDLAGRTSE